MCCLAADPPLQSLDTLADREPCIHAVQITGVEQLVGTQGRRLGRKVAVLGDLLLSTGPKFPIGQHRQRATFNNFNQRLSYIGPPT